MLNVGIVGVTGYTGVELLRWLVQHPQVKIRCITSDSYAGQPLAAIYPSFKQKLTLVCETLDIDALISRCDLVFIALPHGHAANIAEPLLAAGKRVIDLGADFRLKNSKHYENWYAASPAPAVLLATAVYGLPEAGQRAAITSAKLVANPGCYATAAILAMLPALRAGLVDPQECIFDGKSGLSGAGRTLSVSTHFCQAAENCAAYQIAGAHRHTPEIEQALSAVAKEPLQITFTPHLTPMVRGLLVTAYGKLRKPLSAAEVLAIYKAQYAQEPFIRLYEEDELPQTKDVCGSHFCDMAVRVDTRTGRLVVVAAIDNLLKGAAGQAIQNMNLMCAFPETMGLLPTTDSKS